MEPTRLCSFAPAIQEWADTFEVCCWILLEKEISLTASNASSLVIDGLCDQACE